MTSKTDDSLSSSQQMARALFDWVKRSWYAEQQRRWPRTEPPPNPQSGEAWFGDPLPLPVQIRDVSPPDHSGTSIKFDPNERDIAKAFSPRPFLIVSNEDVLDQGWAWVCVLSSSNSLKHRKSLPDWVIWMPELQTHCLATKLHLIRTEFFPDVAMRELLRRMGAASPASVKKVRAAIRRYLDGDFAPKNDPLPPGSVIRYANGSERMVIANCYLGDLYPNAPALATTCLVERPDAVPPEDRTRPVPDVLPFPVAVTPPDTEESPEPTGFVDLVDLQTLTQERLLDWHVGSEPTVLPSIREAFGKLLLGED